MARFLFASTDFAAHLDWGGLLRTARYLRHEGHAVRWCSGPAACAQVRREGVEAAQIPIVDPYRGGRPMVPATTGRRLTVELWRTAFRACRRPGAIPETLAKPYALLVRALVGAWLQEHAVAASCDAVVQLIDSWRPDVVIAEPMMFPAALAAEARHVPLASCGYPGPLLTVHPMRELSTTTRRIASTINALRARVGVPAAEERPDPDLFFFSRRLQIVFFPPNWYGELGGRVSPKVVFVGSTPRVASAAQPQPSSSSASVPLIVMAVPSSYPPDAGLLRAMFDAVAAVGGRGAIGRVDEVRRIVGRIPDHIAGAPWLDYDDLLPRASVFMHHGGLATTHAGIRARIPHLVLPGAIDQCLHAEAIAAARAGLVHTGEVTSAVLTPMLCELLAAAEHRIAARALASRFSACGGIARSAEALVSLSNET